MRRTILLAGALLSVVALGSDVPKEYGDAMVANPLEGTWREIECKGINRNINLLCKSVMSLRNGTCTINYDDGDKRRWNCRINTTRNPPHLDYIDSSGDFNGKTIKHIYQIEGDTLRIATFLFEPDRRPQGFNDDGACVVTYKRMK